jgi:integrase
MKQVVRQYVREIIERGEEDRASRTKITENEREATYLGLSDTFDAASDQLRTNDLTAIAPTVDELLTTHGLSLEKDSTEYRLFSRLVLQGFMAALKVEGERWDGEEEAIDFNSSPANDSAPTVNGTTAPLHTKQLSEVITAYFKEHKREPRTDSQIRSGFKKFTKAIGGDCPIGDITKEKCRTYKEGMAAQKLSVSSVNKYLHSLSHLLTWAKGQGYLPESWMNPVDGLRVKKHRGDKRLKRSPFTDEELAAIFDSPQFTRERTRYPERYWLPLCLLWTGARREEIAQLYLDDVKQAEGVWVFDIKTDEERGQGLKNEASARLVPVHSRLLQSGLLEYVNQTRTAGALRLFPKLKHGKNGFGDSVGKSFARHLKQLGIVDPSKVLHSLRHTAITRLHSRGVSQNIAEALVGHAANTVHGSVYLHRNALPMKLLKEGIEKLDFSVATM